MTSPRAARTLAATIAITLGSGSLVLLGAAPAFAADRPVPGTYATIAAAVAAADPGDTITVTAGTYSGDFALDESIALVGAGAGITTFTGRITVNAPVDISGFTLRGTASTPYTNHAIALNSGGAGSHIHDNVISNGVQGIYAVNVVATEADPTVIEGNAFVNTGAGDAGGVWLYQSDFVEIVDNTFSYDTTGVASVGVNLVSGSSDIRIADNTFTDLGNAIVVIASDPLRTSERITIVGNTIDGTDSSAIYFGGNNIVGVVISGNSISDVGSGQGITFTGGYSGNPTAWIAPGAPDLDDILVEGNTISDAPAGINIAASALLDDEQAIASRGNTFVALTGPAIRNLNEVGITSTDDVFNGASVEGDVALVVTPPKPALAATGIDGAPLAAFAALLLLLGAAFLAARRHGA